MVNTLSVDFMCMYKEMPASPHTGAWEDFSLLDKYSHWTTVSLIGLHVYHCVHEHQCAVMLTFPCIEVNTESAHHNTH